MVDYVVPIMFGILVVTIAWLVLSRLTVTRPITAMVAQRIQFGEGGVRLSDPEGAVARLRSPEEIVIPHEHAILVISFPLTTPASIAITAGFPVGFSREELLRAACEEYANVYEAEEATASTKTVPREERTTNRGRNRTDGVYGIFGHDLEDLVLTSMRWRTEIDGTVRIEMHVEPRERVMA